MDVQFGISVLSAKDRLRQVQNTLTSFLANTPKSNYRLIWHHITGHQETTDYLMEQARLGKLKHLFLHSPDEDWRPEGLHNMSAVLFGQSVHYKGIVPPHYFMVCCDDMQFEPGWFENAAGTIAEFQDLKIGMWSPYRPPEHPCVHPPLERNGKTVWIANSLAPRCAIMELQTFYTCGMFNTHVGSTSDWKLIMEMESRQLGFAVIGGYLVKHVDWGYSPAHGEYRLADECHTDDYLLKQYNGYRGDPGSNWPTYSRPNV